MKFNRFVFDNYLQTTEGIEASKFFSDFWGNINDENADIMVEFIRRSLYGLIPRGLPRL